MNFASVALRYRVVTIVLSVLVVLAGIQAYNTLGRLEDPAFPIKQAVVMTAYPGATPQEVADEVTDPLEEAIQQLEYVDYVSSFSTAGRSLIKVYIQDNVASESLPQVWDELRRKVSAGARQLPSGAAEPVVNDDFGDVYGVLFYVYGDGFSLPELHEYVKFLRDELLLVDGVASVAIQGEPQEAIYLDFDPQRLEALGGDVSTIVSALQGQGAVTPAASIEMQGTRVPVVPSGSLDSVAAIRNMVVQGGNGVTIRLGDVARVSRDVIDPPRIIHRFNDYRAIAIGVSSAAGGNVVTMGEAVQARLDALKQQTPIGIEFGVVSMQSETVKQAVAGFTLGLVESVVIVVGVLLLAMGFRAGLLIGGILLLTILGTFVVMKLLAVDLQRISLGALIIALGMLVDNAIVVVEGIIAGSKKGMSRAEAGRRVVAQTAWPLLGATVIAVLAFAPIGLSPDSTGDYCGSLFTVIWVSLGLSWVFAVTSTPVFGASALRASSSEGEGDPYSGPIFRAFRRFLEAVLAWRWATVVVLLVLLVGSVIGFGKAKQGFFPASARPQFMVDLWSVQGTDIHGVDRRLRDLAQWVREQPGVTDVAANVGAGAMRFELTYSPESPNPAYGQLIVSVEDEKVIDTVRASTDHHLAEQFPDAMGWSWRMVLGPGGEAKIQARLRGPDPNTLRRLADQVEAIMAADPYTTGIRMDWRQRAVTLVPNVDENQMARIGITRQHVNQAIQLAYDGVRVAAFREGDDTLPIYLRTHQNDRAAASDLRDVIIPTPGGTSVPLDQATRGVDLGWEDPIIGRRDRAPTLTVMCDPATGPTQALFSRLQPQIEAIELPIGYTLSWGGEKEKSEKASGGLMALLPVCFGGMALILLALFNNLRQPLIILLTVPLAVIGVTVGLLSTGAEFGFMPILGVLSLTGMLIKNAVVLIDEANAQTAAGATHYDAIVHSAVSRARPVVLAALTTVLGMIPLLTDVFFKDMAIVIIFGLSFATVLTLVVVPVLYAMMYRARPEPRLPNAATR